MLFCSPVPSGGFNSVCVTRPMDGGRTGAQRAHQKAERASSGCLDLKPRFTLVNIDCVYRKTGPSNDAHSILELWTAS